MTLQYFFVLHKIFDIIIIICVSYKIIMMMNDSVKIEELMKKAQLN